MTEQNLTPAQEKALAKLRAAEKGKLFAGNGVSLPTLRVLERLGLCKIEGEVRTWTNYRSKRSHSQYDWTATLTEPQPRPAAEVLATDPIPAGTSVLVGMPGVRIGRDGVRLSEALTDGEYVIQLRSDGVWILPNHDDGAHMTRGQVVGAAERVRRGAPDHARGSVDTDGTLYVSNGRQAARYIPAALIEGYRSDTCPGCGTPYATNGDGPCADYAEKVKVTV